MFAEQLDQGDADELIDLSMLTYAQGTPDSGPGFEGTDIGETHLVGLGAIGNGAIWALARTASLKGSLRLVDHEEVDLSNLQRYVLAGQCDVGSPKVDLARAALADTVLEVSAHCAKWDVYASDRNDWMFERVAVALDNAPDRIAVQGALPKWIVNAWTQELDLGVSRHGFDDGRACLACLYLPHGKIKDDDEPNRRSGFFFKRIGRWMPVSSSALRRPSTFLRNPFKSLLGNPSDRFTDGQSAAGSLCA
ncbi:ThiF family adenylyltransferase [Bradyrhizobium sp. RDT10]